MQVKNKYIFGKSEEEVAHWNECEKHHAPFISIVNKNKEEVEIFYDITNIAGSEELERISNKVKELYNSYLDFLHLDTTSVQEYFDEHYFFRFKVKREFYPVLGEKLFDFLVVELGL